jgi:hypothetical protein
MPFLEFTNDKIITDFRADILMMIRSKNIKKNVGFDPELTLVIRCHKILLFRHIE